MLPSRLGQRNKSLFCPEQIQFPQSVGKRSAAERGAVSLPHTTFPTAAGWLDGNILEILESNPVSRYVMKDKG